MDNIRRKYTPMVDLSKFISNKKTLSKIVTLGYNQFCNKLYPEQQFVLVDSAPIVSWQGFSNA